MVVQQPIVHTEVMLGANDDHPGPRGSAPTPRAGTEIGDGRLTLVSSRPHGHGEVPPPQETARERSRRRRPLSRLSNATLIGLACAGSIGAVGAVNASLFPSLGHPTSESVWQNPGKVPASAAADTTPSPRAERVVVVDPTFALVVGVGPAGGSAGVTIESTSTELAPPSTLDAIGATRPAATSGSSGSGSGSGSGSVQGITTSTVATGSSPTVDSPDHATPSTPSTPSTTGDHGVDGPDTTADATADTTPSATVDSTPSDTTDPASGTTPSGNGGSGRDGSGSGKGGKGG